MAEKEPKDIVVRKDASGDTYDYIETDQVPPGERWCLEHYAFENQTGNRGAVRLYKGDKTLPYFLKEHEAPLANELVFEDAPLFIREGQRLGFRQASCTSGDDLVLYATGYIIRGKYRE